MPRSVVSGWYFKELDGLGFQIEGVIHIGAHLAEELYYYEKRNVRHQIWIEPQPDIYRRMVSILPKRPEVRSFMVACGEASRLDSLRVVSGFDGEASSLLPLKDHRNIHPSCLEVGRIQVPVVPLDDLIRDSDINPKSFNLLVNDTQGYEIRVMEGAVETLKWMKYVVVEVCTVELYEGSPLIGNVDSWMGAHGFTRKAAWLRGARGSYGDALYGRW